jgi:hypothetical protein
VGRESIEKSIFMAGRGYAASRRIHPVRTSGDNHQKSVPLSPRDQGSGGPSPLPSVTYRRTSPLPPTHRAARRSRRLGALGRGYPSPRDQGTEAPSTLALCLTSARSHPRPYFPIATLKKRSFLGAASRGCPPCCTITLRCVYTGGIFVAQWGEITERSLGYEVSTQCEPKLSQGELSNQGVPR